MTRRLQLSGRTRFATVAAAVSALVATAGLTAGPARSAPGVACPAAYPEASLAVGDAVTGLTVTRGTTPETFDGDVLGVVEDGLLPGVDLIMVDLSSPAIARAGVWEGMSGSPVYAADGRLIGAVSYGLTGEKSTIAGITPAPYMQKLLTGSAPATRTTRQHVRLPAALAARVVGSGAASPAAVARGMRPLPLPFSLSGLSSARLKKIAPVLDFGDVTLAAEPAGPVSKEAIPVTAGGNLVASLSYGVLTAGGLGTATMVCGDQVVGFGHPLNFSGPASMTMHGARALFIQDDPVFSGFKVANLGAPVGTVDADRLAGIHGVTGAAPAGTDVTSVATKGAERFGGITHVTVGDFLPDIAFAHISAVQERVFDQISAGTATARWTISGTRKNGSPFRFSRTNMYADPADISGATAIALGEDIYAIQQNAGEVVKIGSVHTSTVMGAPYETYVVSKVQARMYGRWIPVTRNQPTPLRAGAMATLKVFLTSREGAPRTVLVHVFVPLHAAGTVGALHVVGGYVGADAEDFYDEGDGAFEESSPAPSPAIFPNVLKALTAGPQNNEVVATVRFRGAPGTASTPRTGKAAMNRVVSGDLTFPVQARK